MTTFPSVSLSHFSPGGNSIDSTCLRFPTSPAITITTTGCAGTHQGEAHRVGPRRRHHVCLSPRWHGPAASDAPGRVARWHPGQLPAARDHPDDPRPPLRPAPPALGRRGRGAADRGGPRAEAETGGTYHSTEPPPPVYAVPTTGGTVPAPPPSATVPTAPARTGDSPQRELAGRSTGAGWSSFDGARHGEKQPGNTGTVDAAGCGGNSCLLSPPRSLVRRMFP